MLITKGNKSYDAGKWSDEKIQNYINAGWTKAEGESKKPKVKLEVKPDVIPADNEPTILEENDNGSN